MNLGEPIAKGNTASIYLYENKIFKVFNDNLPDTESSYEANKQNYAYVCGLSVPRILEVIKIDGKQAIVMEYVQGKTLGELVCENMEKAEDYLSISVDIQQGIHRIKPDSFELMSEKLSRQIMSTNQLEAKQKSALLIRLNNMTFDSRLCHGDFHLFNLIQSGDDITIIDWVDASAGDPRADVYRTYLLYLQVSVELAELYLHLSCKKSGLSREEIFQWAPIIAGARLAEGVSSESSERLLEIVNLHCPI